MYGITCSGEETSLWNCSYSLSDIGVACGYDAAVVCQGKCLTVDLDHTSFSMFIKVSCKRGQSLVDKVDQLLLQQVFAIPVKTD